MSALIFLIFATVAVVCGVIMVTQRHPIASALSLIGVMSSLAILYLLLGAPFIAAAQLIVYAGAIMVLFLFVIMLLNAGIEPKAKRESWPAKILGVPLIAVFLASLGFLIQKTIPITDMVRMTDTPVGSAEAVGRALFSQYLLPFEVTSVLVLIAILGAVILARKEMD